MAVHKPLGLAITAAGAIAAGLTAGKVLAAALTASSSLTGTLSVAASGLEPETSTLLARMSTQPDETRKAHINTLIAGLKADGLWNKLGLLYVLGAHHEQAGRLNWKKPDTSTLTAVNSPAFVVDRGFAGDGTTSCLVGPALNAIPNFSQNDAHIAAINLDASVGGNRGMVGLDGIAGGSLVPNRGTSEREVRLNSGAAVAFDDNVTTGLLVATRSDGVNASSYRAGVAATTANTSTAVPGNAVTIDKNNVTFSPFRVFMASWGSALTAADYANLRTRLQAYATALGVSTTI